MDHLESRLRELEMQAQRLQSEVQRLREDWGRETQRITDENTELREAVLRYAVACAAVDVQVALLRARGESNAEILEGLQKCTDEQTEASNALRALARRMQEPAG